MKISKKFFNAYKTVYVSKKCEVKLFWRKYHNLHNISVATEIAAFCLPLRYNCLSTRKTSDDDLEETFFKRRSLPMASYGVVFLLKLLYREEGDQ